MNRQMAAMLRARETATCDSHEMACLIYGGESAVQQRREAFERVETCIDTRDTSKLPRCYGSTSREEAYEEGLKWGKAAFEDGLKYEHNFFDYYTPRYQIMNASPFGMTKAMFEPAIRLLGSKDQQDKWLSFTQSGKWIGSYVQTEMAHGSFVRGIQTTATWDQASDQFILQTNGLESVKFWPGALGFSATHGLVAARLVIKDQDYGAQLLMVQLRSLDDGTPMPGIELGDGNLPLRSFTYKLLTKTVGPKPSYNSTCNGYAVFNQVRIPRTHLLGEALARDGTYRPSANPKATYSAMIYARIIIIRGVGYQLAQAATIATRYSVVREQGFGPAGTNVETPLLAYKSQHFRLLTIISKAYAILFTSWSCSKEYRESDTDQEQYLHVLTAGLKAWTTDTAADGSEEARNTKPRPGLPADTKITAVRNALEDRFNRNLLAWNAKLKSILAVHQLTSNRCCGGNGYLNISGLPEIVASLHAAPTFEGENYVLWQQVAQYLFKCLDHIRIGKILPAQMSYLAEAHKYFMHSTSEKNTSCSAEGNEFLEMEIQSSIYRHRALRLIADAYTSVRESDKPPAEAWNEHMMSIIAAARAHVEYIVVASFHTQLQTLPYSTSPLVTSVLQRLQSLFTLSTIIDPKSTNALAFVEDGYLSHTQLSTIRSLTNRLLDELLPDAVALTDAWDFTDASLCSALGMYNGNVYENIMNWVRQLPMNKGAHEMNQGVYQPGWKNWIEPVLKAKL